MGNPTTKNKPTEPTGSQVAPATELTTESAPTAPKPGLKRTSAEKVALERKPVADTNTTTPNTSMTANDTEESPTKATKINAEARGDSALSLPSVAEGEQTIKQEPVEEEAIKQEPIEDKIMEEVEDIKKEPDVTGNNKIHVKEEQTEPHPLFGSTTILFVPQSKSNKHRAELCVKYGGSVATEYSDKVTHIILANGVTTKQLLLSIHRPNVGQDVVVVHENWLADCIETGRVVRPGAHEVFAVPREGERHCISDDEAKPSPKKRRRASGTKSTSTTPPASPKSRNVLRSDMSKSEIELRGKSMLEALHDVRMGDHAAAFASEDEGDDEDEEDENGETRNPKGLKKKQPQKQGDWVDNFLCITGAQREEVPADENPNWKTVDILTRLLEYYEQKHDQWRAQSYKKAINVLRRHPTKICTKKEAMKLSGIGASIGAKIEEIVETNGLKRLEESKQDEEVKILALFEGIWGVGKHTARKWYKQGLRTLEDVAQKATLTPNQQIGLDHYDDFQERMPRDEVTRHFLIVQEAAHELDPGVEAHIMGSYRRGATSSGDIDMIFTKKDATLEELQPFLKRLVNKLSDEGFLTAALTGQTCKWYGCSKLKDIKQWRRIDFLLVPWAEKGAAFIYFTGNELFNRSIRLLAGKKGYSLNQHGLYAGVLRGKKGTKLNDGDMVEGADERKIFELLGVPWWEPWERNV